MKKLKKYEKLTLYLIILGTVIRFLIMLFVDVSAEPAWHVNIARYMANNLRIPLFEHLGRDVFWPPPAFHILMAIFYKVFSIFGENAAIFGAQLVTPILASLTLLFNYLIVKHLFDDKVGFYSSLFLAFLPAHLYFSTLAYVDITLMLFVLMSIYFALKRKYVLSGLFSAISMLTKYTGILAILIVVPMIAIKEKKKIKSYLEYLYTLPLGLIWFIRNWILLGNPVWHFLNDLFKGYASSTSVRGGSLLNFVSLRPIKTLYAGLIGIPASRWSNLFYFEIPFLKIFVTIWLIGTGIYFLPILLGIKNLNKQKNIFLFWLAPFVLMALAYIYDMNTLFLRFFFPVIPILGISWAFGFIKIEKMAKTKKAWLKPAITIFILILVGITAVEFGKAYMSTKWIRNYKVDFDWIKQNTDRDDIFLIEGDQAPSFYFDRFTYYSIEIKNLSKIDYVWINPTLPSPYEYDKEFIKELETNYRLAYSNNSTKTIIYKIDKK